MPAPEHRQCEGCERSLILTEQYFRKCGDGWTKKCHNCLRIERIEQENARLKSEVSRSRAQGLVRLANNLPAGAPSNAALAEQLVNDCGGVEEFSAEVWREYEQNKVGSYGRTRILEMVARIVMENSKAGGAKRAIEQMSDDEIKKELEARKAELRASLSVVRDAEAS